MSTENRWLLPDGIDELLPERASAVEALRRRLLDICGHWGYRYVIPPLVEFTDSLLVGLGADLDVLTCQFADRMSGRMLGVRADITPQVARIDAHSLGEPGVTRLCYAGSTLHSTPLSVTGGRSPIQLGAEVFGCESIDADIEVISLLLTLLQELGEGRQITFDLGHVGIFEAVFKSLSLPSDEAVAIFDAMQRKSAPDLDLVLSRLPAEPRGLIRQMFGLHGSVAVMSQARELLADMPSAVNALDELQSVVDTIARRFDGVDIYIDLTELRGFRYHTGLVFAAYLEGAGVAVAKGGRYDNVGRVYGRARPATGFACDLKALAGAFMPAVSEVGAVAAPIDADPELDSAIAQLRASGRQVIAMLDQSVDPQCTEVLVNRGQGWVVQSLADSESS
jgi:ATP phosphoribosyltransferase regulatory subunit